MKLQTHIFHTPGKKATSIMIQISGMNQSYSETAKSTEPDSSHRRMVERPSFQLYWWVNRHGKTENAATSQHMERSLYSNMS